MTGHPDRAAEWGGVAAAVLWGAVFVGACELLPRSEATGGGAGGGVAQRLVGSTREVFARRFYDTADTYLHKGVGHVEERAFDDPFQRVARQLRPTQHEHAAGAEVQEIMPWLRFATELDPTNAEPWLVAAFWLERSAGRPDTAESVFREARLAAPGDYRLPGEWAKLKLRHGRVDEAARLIRAALRLWPAPLPEDEEEAKRDLRTLCMMRGLLSAYAGDRGDALAQLRRASALPPASDALRRDIAELEAGADWRGHPGLLARLVHSVTPAEHEHAEDGDCLR